MTQAVRIARPDRATRQRGVARSGFTLLELVVVLVILLALAGIALPRYAMAQSRYGLGMAANRVAADVRLTAEGARAAGESRSIQFGGLQDVYWLVDVPDPDRPDQGYLVRLDLPPYEVDLHVTPFLNSILTFDAYGEPSEAGMVTLERSGMKRHVTLDEHGGVALP
ncbi:MAG: prepilin-type N-terminal cleavage/methylation domain-containing protein [Planctomycetota bacterium]